MLERFGLPAVLATCLAALWVLAFEPAPPAASAGAARATALRWVGAELADAPRREADGWEVDVRRADGSLVEVTLGDRLELRELDEERGPGGAPAHDELVGVERTRALAIARPVLGPGRVRGVEREAHGGVEVDVERPDGSIVEVELDAGGRVSDVDLETPGDE